MKIKVSKTQLDYFNSIIEARKNPEMNPFVGAWDYLEIYKNDPDIYISFTEIDKIGINPRSKFNTPLGIYTYPLKEFVKDYIDKGYEKEWFNNSIGYYAPFAGDTKYINFIKKKKGVKFVDNMYSDYGSNDYDKDIQILKNKYSKIFTLSNKLINDIYNEIEKSTSNIMDVIADEVILKLDLFSNKELHKIFNVIPPNLKILHELVYNVYRAKYYKIPFEEIMFNQIVEEGLKTTKNRNPIMSMWNITRLLAEKLTADDRKAMVKWNVILNQDLGYYGFADKSGLGYIHSSEPMQAVFLTRQGFDLLHRVDNKPKKKVQ